MKTKKVAGVDLPASSFAYVGDENDTSTWSLPIFVAGDPAKTRNLIKSALFCGASTKAVRESERQAVFLKISGAAQAHGIPVTQQPAKPQPPALPGGARTETAQLDEFDAEENAAPLDRVSVLLGRSSIRITERHYAPWTRSRQEQIEADLKAAWSNDPVVLTDGKGTPELQRKTGQIN